MSTVGLVNGVVHTNQLVGSKKDNKKEEEEEEEKEAEEEEEEEESKKNRRRRRRSGIEEEEEEKEESQQTKSVATHLATTTVALVNWLVRYDEQGSCIECASREFLSY